MDKIKFWQRKPWMALLLFLSAGCALGLFLAPSTIVLAMLAGIFLLTIFCLALSWKDPIWVPRFQPGAFILALSFSVSGFLLFPENLEGRIGNPAVLRLSAAALATLGFYAFYRLACRLEQELCRLTGLPACREDPFPASNLLLPLSAIGFFAMESQWSTELTASCLVAVAFAFTLCIHSPELLSWSMKKPLSLRIYCLLTCLGILLLRIRQADNGIFSLVAALLGLPFLYLCMTALMGWLVSVFKEHQTFGGITGWEWAFYGLLFLCAALFSILLFSCTDAFYGTAHSFDIIYTSDSPSLLKENVYLSLRNVENDLRQPLFALFSAPFLGLPYLISQLAPQSNVFYAAAMNLPQIALLLVSIFLCGKMLDLDSKKRMIFMALAAVSYPALLFTVMMEQYIVACFWLILCIYFITKEKSQAEIPLCAAGGTLLTSLILIPALGAQNPIRDFKYWFSRMLSLAFGFLLFLLTFGRLDILLNAPTSLLMMLKFSGRAVSSAEKLQQYSGFFRQCILAPEAGVDLQAMGHPSWQLAPAAGFSILGIAILALCVFSAIINRENKACRAAGLWVGFSFLVLFLLGWGTQENGLILYSLYFGWAVWVLLFALLQKLETRIPRLTLLAGIPIVMILAAVNLPALGRLVRFALLYYPI